MLWWLPGLLAQAGGCSQHPQVQHPPPVARAMEEPWSKKLEKPVDEGTGAAEEGAEGAQDADGRAWVLPHSGLAVQAQTHAVSVWRKACCVLLLLEEAARRGWLWIWCLCVSRLGPRGASDRVGGFPAAAERSGDAVDSAELIVRSVFCSSGEKGAQPWCSAVMDPFLPRGDRGNRTEGTK